MDTSKELIGAVGFALSLALFLATLPASVVVEKMMPLPRGLLVDPW